MERSISERESKRERQGTADANRTSGRQRKHKVVKKYIKGETMKEGKGSCFYK